MLNEERLGKTVDLDLCQGFVEEINHYLNYNEIAFPRFNLYHIRAKDEITYAHSLSVCTLMIALAKQLGFSDRETHEAGLAGLLHDVGKVLIPRQLLCKPDKLNSTEFDIMRTHAELGYTLLVESVPVSADVMDACLHHHERFDGSGYPHGLKGEHIGYLARMAAVCDVYDAITAYRPYHAAWHPIDALSYMAEWQGQFDPSLFQALLKALDFYPLGTLVRLQSQHLAVVIEQNREQLSRPVLRVFFSCTSRTSVPVRVLDLSRAAETDKIVSREDPAQWGLDERNEPMQNGNESQLETLINTHQHLSGLTE